MCFDVSGTDLVDSVNCDKETKTCLGVQCILQLAHAKTPIHYWSLPGVPKGIDIYIKRDDLTGSSLTGNKVRKLEFSLSEAINQGYKDVITVGATQSNHLRSTVIAARELGLQTHCVFYLDKHFCDIEKDGNMFLVKAAGANGYFVSTSLENFVQNCEGIMNEIADEIKKSTGRCCYKIPNGGSCLIGVFGYIEAFHEMLEQGIADHVTDIVVTCGSGGTVSGLAIANYLACNGKIRIHGILIGRNLQAIYDHIDENLQELGLTTITSRDIVQLVSYKGCGYAQNTQQELDFIHDVSRSTGIILDSCYTGKGAYGMIQEILHNPQRFKGNKILFIHTGGIYRNFTGETSSKLDKPPERQIWKTWQSNL